MRLRIENEEIHFQQQLCLPETREEDPGVWRDLFEAIVPDETSDDNELREYLSMETKKTRKEAEEHDEAMEEAALMCSEPMFPEDD